MTADNCKVCKQGTLVKYDAKKYPDEEIEQYDPEGFRSNYECTACHTVFGTTKSSSVAIVDSIYTGAHAESMSLAQHNYLWNGRNVRTKEQLEELALTGDKVAIEVLIQRTALAEQRSDRLAAAVRGVNSLLKEVAAAEEKGRRTFFWRGLEHNVGDYRCFLDMIFWEQEVC